MIKLCITTVLLLFIVALSLNSTYAQTNDATISVNACYDQNADGDCTDSLDGPPPPGAEACLNDTTLCQPIPATFTNLSPGTYTPFLQFPGPSQGHYPTTPKTPITVSAGESANVTLGTVYPFHPKDIAVHVQLNKVYVAFQGPTINGIRPHPFVAVIDGDTDEVLRTIPGGENGNVPQGGQGVGRDAWGVEVSANGAFVYVGAFADGIITIIDPTTDSVITSISPGQPFKPVAPAINPQTGRVHFTDYDGGRMLVLNDNPATFPTNPIPAIAPVSSFPNAFSPFEITVADTPFGGYNFITLRDAFAPTPYSFTGLRSDAPFNINYHNITLPGNQTGQPHAIALWQETGRNEARLYITYATDPRPGGVSFPNPNLLAMYGFSPGDPDNVALRAPQIPVGDYAEVGLIRNPDANHMLGTYAGFAYLENLGHVEACDNPARGGNYALTFNGDRLGVADGGSTPEVWKYPEKVIGNPPLVGANLRWRNPFELAHNPNNGKIYVTDRCWNEFPGGGQPGGGAVLIFNDTSTPDTPSETNPALTVTKTDSRDPIIAGMVLTYTIRVNNSGDVNLTADIVDLLPPQVTPLGPNTWNNIFIPFGGFWETTLPVQVAPGTSGILTNRVEVTTDEGATGQAIEETQAVISAIQVYKTDSIDPVPAGNVLTYTIQVQNVGELDLNATIIDLLPPEVTPLGPTNWQNILIPADQLLTLTLPVRVDPQAVGPLVNRVDVTTVEGPANYAQETTLVANLEITKTATPNPVNAGDLLTYTIRVNNTGSADLNANIVDLLPPEVSPLGPTGWNNVFIPAGGVWEQTLVGLVDVNTFRPITNRVNITTQQGVTGTAEITTGVISRGVIFIKACHDQDADGVCLPSDDPLPPGALGCLRDSTGAELGCQPVDSGPDGATFTNLISTNTYTPYLQLTGQSQGYYPTTRPQTLAIDDFGLEIEVVLGAVYPVHPKGVAVHAGQNKAYVAVQGPKVGSEHPFPFVAVLDGDTDEALYTIPGGPNGIGRGPWGVAAAQDYVYVGSFEEGRISVIDPTTDQVVANLTPAGAFQPTAPALNPATGRVHFPDYRGGRSLTLQGTAIVDGAFAHFGSQGYSPFEMAIGSTNFSYVTLRDALLPHPYGFTALNNANRQRTRIPINLPNGQTGNPHAIGLWEQSSEGHLFITYASDPRRDGVSFPNPNKLAVYRFSNGSPQAVGLQQSGIQLGDYAEVGLIFDLLGNQMLGTYAGFPYDETNGVAAACDTPVRGGTYTLNFNGAVQPGFLPGIAVGTPPLAAAGLDYRNPFELAVNPNNGKIYITDRCWHDFPGGAPIPGNRGAVLVVERSNVGASNVQRANVPTFNPVADVNGDGLVNIIDLTFIASRYGTTDSTADLNKDGKVDIVDVTIAAANYTR